MVLTNEWIWGSLWCYTLGKFFAIAMLNYWRVLCFETPNAWNGWAHPQNGHVGIRITSQCWGNLVLIHSQLGNKTIEAASLKA